MATNLKKRDRHLRSIARRKARRAREAKLEKESRRPGGVIIGGIRVRRGKNAHGEWVKREVVAPPLPPKTVPTRPYRERKGKLRHARRALLRRKP